MSDLNRLVSGFRSFKATEYESQKDLITHILDQGTRPKTMFITCADIRTSPDRIFAANPGDLYVVRNIGGLVPPYGSDEANGVISSIEYAALNLEVENIIVLGHRNCESIKTLMATDLNDGKEPKEVTGAIKKWLGIASEAKEAVISQMSENTDEERHNACEQESIIVSMRNLMGYPCVKGKMENDTLNIYGWHFNIKTGELFMLDPDTGFFEPVS